MRKSLLTPSSSTNGGSIGTSSVGRATDFIALTDHADLADTSQFSFAELMNRDGQRIFELNNPMKSNVRHIGTEDVEDSEFDYCVAFFNRRTKKAEFKPVSFLRVAPMKSKQLEESGILTGKKKYKTVNYGQNNSLSWNEMREKREVLTMEHGNAKKRKILDAQNRRKIGNESMSVMNDSLMKNEGVDETVIDDSTLDTSMIDIKNKKLAGQISLLKTADSMVLPKMNATAKTPDEVFNLEDFFTAEELIEFKYVAKTFFATYSTLEKICELGVAKFIARRILESWRRTELHAASALHLLILAMIMPRGNFKSTNVNLHQKQTLFSPQIVQMIDSNFIKGKMNREGKCMIEKTYKDRILAHIFALYFALATAGDYVLSLGSVSTELQVSDGVAKKMLGNIGCMIQTATAEQKRTMNTTSIALLVGPTRGGARGRMKRKR